MEADESNPSISGVHCRLNQHCRSVEMSVVIWKRAHGMMVAAFHRRWHGVLLYPVL